MSPARARTRSARSGVERTNHEATAPPICGRMLAPNFYVHGVLVETVAAYTILREVLSGKS